MMQADLHLWTWGGLALLILTSVSPAYAQRVADDAGQARKRGCLSLTLITTLH